LICLHCEKNNHHHLLYDLDSFLFLPFTFLTYTFGEAGTLTSAGTGAEAEGAGLSGVIAAPGFFSCVPAGFAFVPGDGPVPGPLCFLAVAPAVASSGLTSGVPFFTERKGVLDLAGILGGAFDPEVPVDKPEEKQREILIRMEASFLRYFCWY